MTAWSEPELAGRIANAVLTDRPLRLRTVPCACGGEITAPADDPGPEVRRHNAGLAHMTWWARLERQGRLEE